jgi:uncharacterized membrane protein
MAELDTTVAVYGLASEADGDWAALEQAAESGQIELADAALVENRNGEAVILQRQSHHGWGKGAVAGAVIGVLFPPSLIGAAAVGAGGGALVAGMTRALGRGKVKDLGETLDTGEFAILVVSPTGYTNSVSNTLKAAKTTTTVPMSSDVDIRQVLRDSNG